MPQANITYDNAYNKHLASKIAEMDEKHWRKAGTAYSPTMFQDKTGNYFGEKIGGGSPAGQKYILSGNSPAYPPINIRSGMMVTSGGSSHRAGVDGAVGGYSFNDFLGDVAHVGKSVAPDIIREIGMPLLKGAVGLGKKKRGKKMKGGNDVLDGITGVIKTLAPFAPLLLGLGLPAPKKKADVVSALKHLGAKPSHTIAKLHEMLGKYKLKSGGYSVQRFLNDHVNPALESLNKSKKPYFGIPEKIEANKGKIAEVAKDLVSKAKKALGAGKKKGGMPLSDMIESIKPIGKSAGVTSGGVQSGGKRTNKRALIVKKVMQEKGLKLIEASKYVKAHGLYKP